jgi:TRAP-type C4-dicarboxylate transport system permease small subunit
MEDLIKQMTRKILLVVLTVCPLVYFVYFGIFAYDVAINSLRTIGSPSEGLPTLLWLHAITIVLLFLGFVIYTFHLYRNRQLSGEGKMLWLLAFVVLTSFAFLAYWWQYVWPDNDGGEIVPVISK